MGEGIPKNPTPPMDLKVREVKGVMVVSIGGRIDLNASELIELVGWLLKRGKYKILLDFEQVDLLDYNGLTALAIAFKNVRNRNGVLKFVNVPRHIEKLLHIAELLDVFELYGEMRLALKSFQEAAEPPLPPLRRRFRRLGIANIPVRFLPAYRQEDPRWEGKAVNLGGEGLFLYASKVFPLHTELILTLQLDTRKPPLTVKGVVIWIADKELQPHRFPGMGVRFHRLGAENQKAILAFIDRNLTQRSDA